MSKLTPKQQRFAQEYLVDLNAKQAAIRAGYSEKTAEQQGSRLLSNVKVQKFINTRVEKRAERTEISQDYVLNRLKIEAERDDEGSSHSARVSAVGLLGKHLSMFTDKTENTHDIEIRINRVDKDD